MSAESYVNQVRLEVELELQSLDRNGSSLTAFVARWGHNMSSMPDVNLSKTIMTVLGAAILTPVFHLAGLWIPEMVSGFVLFASGVALMSAPIGAIMCRMFLRKSMKLVHGWNTKLTRLCYLAYCKWSSVNLTSDNTSIELTPYMCLNVTSTSCRTVSVVSEAFRCMRIYMEPSWTCGFNDGLNSVSDLLKRIGDADKKHILSLESFASLASIMKLFTSLPETKPDEKRVNAVLALWSSICGLATDSLTADLHHAEEIRDERRNEEKMKSETKARKEAERIAKIQAESNETIDSIMTDANPSDNVEDVITARVQLNDIIRNSTSGVMNHHSTKVHS